MNLAPNPIREAPPMVDPTITDLRRELDKAREALKSAEQHLARHAEMNAALHCADRVMYSPLHAKVTGAISQIDHALARTEPTDDQHADYITRLIAGVLADLDRCRTCRGNSKSRSPTNHPPPERQPPKENPMSPPYYRDEQVTLLLGDALDQLRGLPAGSVDCIVTSPPYYGLRDYGTPGQYGLEETPAAYVETMRALFAEARRVLADDGTLWLNLGDSYAYPPGSAGRQGATGQRANRTFTAEGLRGTCALPPKNLLMIPARVAIALQDDGWIIRNENVWWKRNGMPEKAQDRLTGRHEKVYLLTKQQDYWFDLDAIRLPVTEERARHDRNAHRNDHRYAAAGTNHGLGPTTLHRTANPLGSNPGDVWDIPTRPYPQAHFAVFPIDLPLRCIKAGCRPGGTVLDPFSGSGTTGEAARKLGRKYVGIDLNEAYHQLAMDRFAQGVFAFDGGDAA